MTIKSFSESQLDESLRSGDGDEVNFTKDQLKTIKKLEGLFKAKARWYYTTIHGVIITLDVTGFRRITMDMMKTLSKMDIRWYEPSTKNEPTFGIK